jgi:NAD(P)-dependent dehydrogenase (short-subunit alcohol dehydrogenase family)
MDLELNGRRAIVAGGSAGIGAAIVETLVAEGCDVFYCARDRARIERFDRHLAETRQAGHGKAAGSSVDVADRAAVAAWLDAVGPFDIAVANASALSGDWQRAVEVDLHGTLNLIEEAGARLTDGGALTYIASKAAGMATPGAPAYGAIKAAMTHVAKTKAVELVARGVRVNVVSPGDTFVVGGFWDRVREAAPDAYAATIAANPLGRLAEPAEIARVVAFISSPAASFVSGANWHVDGGATQHVRL